MLRTLVLTVLCLGPALAVQERRRDEPRRSPELAPRRAAFVSCTPGMVAIGNTPAHASPNPIAEALQNAAPGALIEVQAGEYPSFAVGFAKAAAWAAATSGGTAAQPIVVRAVGDVRVVPTSSGDTLAIAQQRRCGWITFEGLTFVCGYRAGIMFYKCGPNELHEGFRFLDCNVEGGFDHVRGVGNNSKWGVWGHSLKDFEFRGVKRRPYVRSIRQEHGFYLQNPRGDVTIENVDASRLGRTFVQFTSRPGDGAPGVGTITVRNCRVEDACIARGDDFKGGSAFTVAGRHEGTLIFERNRYRAGFSRELLGLTREGVPYGTGAFVSWDGRGEPSRTLVLEDNDFELAPGCGDRPLVSIGGCRELRIAGHNRFAAGANVALDLDPPPQSGFATNPCGRISLAETTELRGGVRWRGETASEKQLSELRPKPAAGTGTNGR